MAQSYNHTVDITENGTSYMGLGIYGKIMVGDKAFEFYDDRNVENNLQIRWTDVDFVIVSLMFGGKRIPRFALRTQQGIDYSFSSKHPHAVLRAVRKYIAPDHIVRSQTFFQVLFRGLHNVGSKVTGSNKATK